MDAPFYLARAWKDALSCILTADHDVLSSVGWAVLLFCRQAGRAFDTCRGRGSAALNLEYEYYSIIWKRQRQIVD
jgi:hypothetical protein